MNLKYKEIEEIANAIIFDYNKFENLPTVRGIALELYKLFIKYLPLSNDFSVLGLTAFDDTTYYTNFEEKPVIYYIQKHDLVLNIDFVEPKIREKHKFEYNYTLAYQFAQHILFTLSNEYFKYENDGILTPVELKSYEKPRANRAKALAMALLMPQKFVYEFMLAENSLDSLTCYGTTFKRNDSRVINLFCKKFSVSKEIAIERLKILGLLKQKSYYELMKMIEV